ncbi:uncharacterized protein BP5553_01944 [Venustampulla echinocandica]|uniref:Luciferase domain-containing protein n=1 Tax=Venustampulla echinocandica TaxID=2656787 RepID=A0A370U2I2_9HELO|nr:uncharacterized protein BP5553_01944 [Venustampulla echinocandica]RDL41965.1 hypothetical protein BP5553_01944 [Venustampulla echinocandica]
MALINLDRLHFRTRPFFSNHFTAIAVVASSLLVSPLLRLAYIDYQTWYDLGPGGLPRNVLGWLIQAALRPIAKETLSTACYSEPKTIAQAGVYSHKSFLIEEAVPVRTPPRPDVGNWTVPQRQRSEFATDETKEHIQSHIQQLAHSSASNLRLAPSRLERHGTALFLTTQQFPHPAAQKTKGEITHMHEIDGSLHVSLAPKDAQLVIERGWGQRHPLSGGILYAGYVFIYAPRTSEEEAVVQGILDAGVKFMVGGQPGSE